jgi:hypothetical protein
MARKRKPPSQRNPNSRFQGKVKAKMLDGTIEEIDLDNAQQFRPGPWRPQSPKEPDNVPDAPDYVITGNNGHYFGWTHWGRPGMTARSARCPTEKEAFENLAQAIREFRKLMMDHPKT